MTLRFFQPSYSSLLGLGSRFLRLLLCVVLTISGCASSAEPWLPFDGENGDGTFQLAPNNRAVAIIDSAYHQLVLDQSGIKPDLNGVIESFFATFDIKVDALIIIHDMEYSLITLERMFVDEGYDFLEGSSEIPEDVLEQVHAQFNGVDKPLNVAFNTTVRSFESGIGDRELAFPPQSPDSFRGHVFLPTREDLPAGRFFHELGHFWSAYLDGPTSLRDHLQFFGNHWGFTSVGGLLGGWLPGSLVDLGNDTYQAEVASAGRASNLTPFALLELYLMGLVGAEEVPPVEVALDVSILELDDQGLTTFMNTAFETITIGQIIEANGLRIPDVDHSPKNISLGLVILANHPLSDSEWEFYTRAIDFLTAAEDRSLYESFPEDFYPIHTLVWQATEAFAQEEEATVYEEGYQNFFMATDDRGTIEFVELTP